MPKWYMVPKTTPYSNDPVLITVLGYDLPVIASFREDRFIFWHRGKEICEYLDSDNVKYWMPLPNIPEVIKSNEEIVDYKWNEIPQNFPDNGDMVFIALHDYYFPKIAEFRDDIGKAHFIYWNSDKKIHEFADSGNVVAWMEPPPIPKNI